MAREGFQCLSDSQACLSSEALAECERLDIQWKALKTMQSMYESQDRLRQSLAAAEEQLVRQKRDGVDTRGLAGLEKQVRTLKNQLDQKTKVIFAGRLFDGPMGAAPYSDATTVRYDSTFDYAEFALWPTPIQQWKDGDRMRIVKQTAEKLSTDYSRYESKSNDAQREYFGNAKQQLIVIARAAQAGRADQLNDLRERYAQQLLGDLFVQPPEAKAEAKPAAQSNDDGAESRNSPEHFRSPIVDHRSGLATLIDLDACNIQAIQARGDYSRKKLEELGKQSDISVDDIKLAIRLNEHIQLAEFLKQRLSRREQTRREMSKAESEIDKAKRNSIPVPEYLVNNANRSKKNLDETRMLVWTMTAAKINRDSVLDAAGNYVDGATTIMNKIMIGGAELEVLPSKNYRFLSKDFVTMRPVGWKGAQQRIQETMLTFAENENPNSKAISLWLREELDRVNNIVQSENDFNKRTPSFVARMDPITRAYSADLISGFFEPVNQGK
ncbi:MAG: hypothetical protein ACK54H_05785 [Phycisphaerales bacterium]